MILCSFHVFLSCSNHSKDQSPQSLADVLKLEQLQFANTLSGSTNLVLESPQSKLNYISIIKKIFFKFIE